MSLRCQLGFYRKDAPIEDYEVLVYRHHDGAPQDVIPDIVPILKDFDVNRGLDDVEYSAAWLIAKLKTDYTDIGVGKTLHADIEYFYAIYPDKIEIYDTEQSSVSELNDFKKIDTIKLQ